MWKAEQARPALSVTIGEEGEFLSRVGPWLTKKNGDATLFDTTFFSFHFISFSFLIE